MGHPQYWPLGEASEAPTLGLVPNGGHVLMQVKQRKRIIVLNLNVNKSYALIAC